MNPRPSAAQLAEWRAAWEAGYDLGPIVVNGLWAEIDVLRQDAACDVCAGTGKPISGKPCICRGTGSAIEEAREFHKLLYDAEGRIQELEEQLLESNDLLRSCSAVATREGIQTNWAALNAQLIKALEAQHQITNAIRAARRPA